jgi:hypothetical protein
MGDVATMKVFTPQAKIWEATSCQIKHQQALYDEDWAAAASVSLELNGMVGALSFANVAFEQSTLPLGMDSAINHELCR